MVTIDPSYFIGLGQSLIGWSVFVGVNYALKRYVFGERYPEVVIELIKWGGILFAAIALSLGFAFGTSADSFWRLMTEFAKMKGADARAWSA